MINKSDNYNARALGLCSGGLDSILSALVLREQGVYVEWITFETPFFPSEKAGKASVFTGIPLTVRNITPVYIEMLKNPRCGYGQNMNPCRDCHALMFRCAGTMMKEKGFDFLFSGEVLGQRPLSQTKTSLRYVEKNSGFDGYIVRPLSAQRLPPTVPEKQGMVNRELLLDITGRTRKPQIKLAKQFGVTDYPAPGGGCLLTDKGFSIRLKDLFDQQDEYAENEFHLLKFGRHFRLDNNTKIIVGRTKDDNENLVKYHNPDADTVIKVKNYPGPVVLIPHGGSKDMVIMAASICVAYSKAPGNIQADVSITTPHSREIASVKAILHDDFKGFMICAR